MRVAATAELEIEILEDLNLRGWRYLTSFYASLARETKELDGFLDTYYRQLEGWLLLAVSATAAGGGGETSSAIPELLHKRQKSIYREIVKRCHPDVATDASLQQFLHPAMEAYERGDGEQLARLRMMLWQRTLYPAEYRQCLQESYRLLQQDVALLRQAVMQQRSSAGWKLYQRICLAREAGFDLLAFVVRHLQRRRMRQNASIA